MIIGTVEFEPGARDARVPVLLRHRERCLRGEPGTIAFEVLLPAKEPDRILLDERYADRAAIDAHWTGKSMALAKQEAGARLKGITGTICTPRLANAERRTPLRRRTASMRTATVHLYSVYLGYVDGKPLPTCHHGRPLYGRLQTETVRSLDVVNLWPHDFPLSARLEDSQPVAALWRPQLSGILHSEFGLSGVERQSNGRWVAQRWLIEPLSFNDIERELAGKTLLGEIAPGQHT